MQRLRRFAKFTTEVRFVLLRALLVVGVARAALWLLPVSAVRKVVGLAAAGAAGYSPRQLIWAVRATSRCLPGSTCLTQALAAQALLVHSGYPSQVEIGVNKNDAGFQAHAWLVCQGEVLLGGPQNEQ